jgi:hypothetical protein
MNATLFCIELERLVSRTSKTRIRRSPVGSGLANDECGGNQNGATTDHLAKPASRPVLPFP